MSKIGIAIKSTSAGSGQPSVINGGDWTKRVIDVRDILKHVPSMASDHSIVVVFASYTEDACLITVARTVSGRPWDNVSGWIHIPSNLVISGQEVSSIISKVKKIISASELPEESELKAVFSTEYASKGVSARYDASKKDGKFAKRNTVLYSLEELLGEYRYQSYYSEYNAVFLVSDVDAITDAVDLSAKPLSALITLMPPTTKEIQDKLGRFVTLRLTSGQPFNDAILLNKNQNITLIAERDGYEPISFMLTAETDGQKCVLPKTVWSKKISTANFDVKSESGKDLNDRVKISVNDVDITTRPYTFSEDECENAYVVITANGYDTFKSKVRLLGNNRLSIVLDRKIEEFRKKIHLKNGSTGEISIAGKGINRYESPIKGYIENNGYLEYMPGNVWLQRLIGFGVAVALWLIVLFIGWWNSVEFQTSSDFPWIETVSKAAKRTTIETQSQYAIDNSQNVENTDNATVAQTSPTDHSAAISYLDSHDVWEKSELEKYPDLQGLFDDLNNMETFRLGYTWEEKLKESSNFKKVAKVAKKNFDKGWNPKQGPHNPTFNTSPEYYRINLTNYTNWLDRDQTPKTSTKPQTPPTTTSNPKGKSKEAAKTNENKFDAKNLN